MWYFMVAVQPVSNVIARIAGNRIVGPFVTVPTLAVGANVRCWVIADTHLVEGPRLRVVSTQGRPSVRARHACQNWVLVSRRRNPFQLVVRLMKLLVLALLATVSLSACHPSPSPAPEKKGSDSFDALSAVRPEMLAAFDEVPLTRGGTDDAVRIFYIPTFDHPFMIRHSFSGTVATNRAVVLSGKGGYDPGTICFESSSASSYAQVEDRISRLDAAGFWRSPAVDATQGSDGAVYLIEVVKNGQYRGWKRWAPQSRQKERRLESLNLFLLGEILNEGLVGVACKPLAP